MTLDFSRARLTPFQHQAEDVQRVIDSPFLFITSEMRTGKTKIVIDAAQFMYEAGIIDKVLVIAPAPVRDVWFDPVFGEIKKHSWLDVPITVKEFHARSRVWIHGPQPNGKAPLEWLVTNYEFLVSKNRVAQLMPYCTAKTLIVMDESSYIKTHKAQRTKACMQLRNKCGRAILLNGTPISDSPLDLFSQGNILHPSILDCKYVTQYKARYAETKPLLGFGGKPVMSQYGRTIEKIVGWRNLDDLQQRFAPHVVRRLQKDCLDWLPEKLEPITLTATLTPSTWKMYCQMRDEMVVWLENGTVANTAQAAVKVMRLSQITSGFLGGIEEAVADFGDLDLDMPTTPPPADLQEIGREKLDLLLAFLKMRLETYPNLHIVVWCRFRVELIRMMKEIAEQFPQFELGTILGQQHKTERANAMRLLHPDTSPTDKPVLVGGTFGTGSFGLNFTAANHSVNCSFDYSYGKFLQARDRVYGPGQTSEISYFDMVATGPKGQRTIDHVIVEARRNKQNTAEWTTRQWAQALKAE